MRLRIVGALADSVLQSELIIGEAAFVRLFPRHEGYRVWLIDTSAGRGGNVTAYLEDRLSDFGLDVIDTHERLGVVSPGGKHLPGHLPGPGIAGPAARHRRSGRRAGAQRARATTRNRHCSRAVGFTPVDVRGMVLSEGLTLVLGGFSIGTACAVIAILPALRDRAQSIPIASLVTLLVGVVVTGAVASLIAIRLTTRTPVVTAIKAE